MKTHLAEVKEEPQEREAAPLQGDNYFRTFLADKDVDPPVSRSDNG